MTNTIEKQIDLNAPQSKVWQALSDYRQFNEWFGCTLNGPFAVGQACHGTVSCGGEPHDMNITVTALDPESYFAYTWHPYALEADVDYSKEAPTLVEFRLSTPSTGKTLLVVTESGFDKVPEARREEAFRMNSNGWAMQLESIEEYLSGTAVS